MKLSYILILIFLRPANFSEPVLELPKIVNIDVKLGKTAIKTIKFKNNGSSELLLHEVSSDCSCTVADFTKMVKPRSEGEIIVKYNSSGKRKGISTQMLIIKSNIPQKFWFCDNSCGESSSKFLKKHLRPSNQRFLVSLED